MRNIKLLGIRSSKYMELSQNLFAVIKELEIEVNIEEFGEVEDFIKFNIIKIPALIIDEKIITKGYVPNIKELKKLLTSKEMIADIL